jgi:hypothetical protein
VNDDGLTNSRDEKLGVALRELDVPEHDPRFWVELASRLAEERPAAVPRRLRRVHLRRLRFSLGVAAVAAATAIAVVAIGIPGTDGTPHIGPELATAAEVKAHVRASLSSMRSLSGVLVSDGPEQGDERRWRFTLSADGDFRLVGPTGEETITYDASGAVARSAQRSASIGGDTIFYAERRGVPPGPPDQGPPTWLVPGEFGAFVRALLAAADPRVREVAYEGRPAWRLAVDAVPSAIVPAFSGDRFEITVDRETGIPVRVVEQKNGTFLRELRIERLSVNTDVAPRTFRLEFPDGAEVMRSDDGFRRVELAEVAGVVGYAPLVPAWMPDGYALAEVAVAREGGPTGKEAGNPLSPMVVSLSYRRGLDQFLVTTRLSRVPTEDEPGRPLEERWSDPLATGEGFVDDAEELILRRGVLRGTKAEVVIVPRGMPHLWALTDQLVLTVGGDLSRAELIRVAESLGRDS